MFIVVLFVLGWWASTDETEPIERSCPEGQMYTFEGSCVDKERVTP
jgi:hypothetical protein